MYKEKIERMKNYIKIPVCAIAFVVGGLGAIMANDAYDYNNKLNNVSNVSLLNAENISSYGDGWVRVANLLPFIDDFFDPEVPPQPKK